jgi:RNA polymerase sigma-70 factor (ECF subfamily)
MTEPIAPARFVVEPTGAAPPGAASAERAREWYQTYGKAVYTYLRFHLPNADIAEDVAADTFLKVFRSADRFDESRGQARTWIFRIAQNTLRDHQRRTRVRRHVSLTSMRDLAADAPSPEERLLWEEQVARLLAAVTGLSESDREIISLRYGSGLDSAAVAEILGIKESAARTRLWRALARLRVELERDR